jgi:hypothetical protein
MKAENEGKITDAALYRDLAGDILACTFFNLSRNLVIEDADAMLTAVNLGRAAVKAVGERWGLDMSSYRAELFDEQEVE